MDLRLGLTFPHSYQVEVLDELPGGLTSERYYYPGASTDGGADGVLIRVVPQGRHPWLGTFAFGRVSRTSVTGVYTCPDVNNLCVIAAGAGYIVDTRDPNVWEEVPREPIMDVRPILERSILVFSDITQLTAYGPDGISWTTRRVSWDGITIIRVDPEELVGSAWDAPLQRQVEFRVDLRNGAVTGPGST
jgi:hypothetical protein